MNQWVSIVAVVVGAVVLAWMRRHPIAEPVIPAPADEAIGSVDGADTADHAEPVDGADTTDHAEPVDGAEPTD